MPQQTQPPDFANFPRRDLAFKYTRRQFLTTLTREYEASVELEQGVSSYKLNKLGSLPDEALAQISPCIAQECEISMADGYIWGQSPETRQPFKLFKTDQAALFAFNQMNGRITLTVIAASLAQEMDWETAYSFAYARGLFLHLVQQRVCLPQ